MSDNYSPKACLEKKSGVKEPTHADRMCKRKSSVPSRHVKVDELAEAMQADRTSGAPTPVFLPSRQLLHLSGAMSASPGASAAPMHTVPLSAYPPQPWPGQPLPQMPLQTFTSIVAAAAAAGAMAAIRQLPAAQAFAHNGTPEQNAAFMAAANAAASAAAAQAVALTPANNIMPQAVAIPLPNGNQQLLNEAPAMSEVLPDHQATPTAAAAQQPAQATPDGEAPRPAASDTSAHQPLQAPQHGQPEQQLAADTPESEAAGASDASPFEQALIKRLQLYAWLVSCHATRT